MWLEQYHSTNKTMFSGKHNDWLPLVFCTNNTRLSVYCKFPPNSIKKWIENKMKKYGIFFHLPSNFLQVMLEDRTHIYFSFYWGTSWRKVTQRDENLAQSKLMPLTNLGFGYVLITAARHFKLAYHCCVISSIQSLCIPTYSISLGAAEVLFMR